MSAFHDIVLAGASGSQGYQISRSVRLRSSASAYFNRTPGSAGNQQIHTISFWTKYSTGSSDRQVISFGNSLTYQIYFGSSGTILGVGSQQLGVSNPWFLGTTQVFRDPSAWYHIVVAVDTTQATASNRVKIYINGVQITSFSTANYPTQNYNTGANSASSHSIGRREDATQYYDGYLTEINWVDGQQLTPSSFGQTNTTTGVWSPKKYTGTYGTNGFFLNFSDNSAATAAAIGKDYSGNGNNWTPNNISVTAGTTYDSMLDVPTAWADGGNGRGNYCVANTNDKANTTVTNGNLTVTTTNIAAAARGTISVSSGKWYWEVTTGGTNPVAAMIGVARSDVAVTNCSYQTANGWYYFAQTGQKFTNNTGSTYGASYSSAVIGVALDCDNGTLAFYKDGAAQGTAFTGLAGLPLAPNYDNGSGTNGSTGDYNFGQRPFAYTPPTGFKALHTGNLPEPSIPNGRKWFDATTYTGNGSTLAVTNAGGFQPDLVWGKSRSLAQQHLLFDSVRGAGNYLQSQSTAAEATDNTTLSSFNSNGFTLGSNITINTNASTNVAWQWKESPSSGFDIVTYTGSGANRTVTHGLGVAPKMMIVKNRTNGSAAYHWFVYHASIGATDRLLLNTTGATAADSAAWNNTAPTSSVFSVGTGVQTNESGSAFVAYLFSEVAGFSKLGSYTGNGSSDGPFVFCGFRPRYVMVKRTDSTSDWFIHDTARDANNLSERNLYAQLSNAEDTLAAGNMDLLSNGFKLRTPSNGNPNVSGGTYIFAAFAENPFKYALAR